MPLPINKWAYALTAALLIAITVRFLGVCYGTIGTLFLVAVGGAMILGLKHAHSRTASAYWLTSSAILYIALSYIRC